MQLNYMNQTKFKKIALRLDDFHEKCHLDKWNFLVSELMKRGIPIHIGLIPRNNDKDLNFHGYNFNHWKLAYDWQSKGAHFWIHGFEHNLQKGNCAFSLSNKGEFFDSNDSEVEKKISKAISLFKTHKIKIAGYIAPAHGYSQNILDIIERNENLKIIWDGYWYGPRNLKNLNFIPQQFWKIYPLFLLPSFSGVCIHPSEMSYNEISDLLKKIDNLNINNFKFELNKIIFQKMNYFDVTYSLLYRVIKYLKN